MSKKPRTSRAEEVALAARIATGDVAARNELAVRNIGLVHYIAARFASPATPEYEDFVQAGGLGLLKATARFDPARGTRFGTFAGFWIKKSMISLTHRSNLVDSPYRHRHGTAPAPGEVISLSTPIGDNGDRFCDHLGDEVAISTRARSEARLDVRRLLVRAGLTEREAHLLHARFWEERTLESIGADLGVSRERARQVAAGAFVKLRAASLPPH